MSALEKLKRALVEQKPSKEDILKALAKIYPQASREHKQAIRELVIAIANLRSPSDWHDLRRALRNPPKLDVDPSLLLPFVEEGDWRETTRSAPDWGKFVIAQVLRLQFGLQQKDLPSVFAALGDDAPLKKAVSREAHIRANPSGTGRHPKREHEKAATAFLASEDDRNPLERLASSARDVAEIVAEADFIQRAFQKLPPEEQTILRLDAEGYTDAEIAAMMNLPRETVKKRRQRAKKRLAEALSA